METTGELLPKTDSMSLTLLFLIESSVTEKDLVFKKTSVVGQLMAYFQ